MSALRPLTPQFASAVLFVRRNMKHPIVWIAAMLSIAAGKPAALGQVSTLAGVWTGTLTNSPARPNATMEIGTLADKPNACAQLKTT